VSETMIEVKAMCETMIEAGYFLLGILVVFLFVGWASTMRGRDDAPRTPPPRPEGKP
jgi:hypothetical protein